ncbi:hypothetical protein PSY31_22960, partial [Shigella flexneri]|nr:hypothetical protein [Shigella flexneri]
MSTRLETYLFDGKGDFLSWKKKMRALLTHHKVLIALEADTSKWSKEKMALKDEIDEEAHSLITLNLT